MANRRARGYIVDMDYAKSENTRTPYEVQIMTRIVYIRPNDDQRSYLWARVTARSNNLLLTDCETFSDSKGKKYLNTIFH